jgi:adenylate cyclase class 2
MAIEVEQKFRVADRSALEARLAALGCRLESPCEQVDQYYAHPNRDFARSDEALRLRQVGSLNYITYKGPKLDTHTKTRREIELDLAPGVAAAADAEQLLLALGFVPVREVRKRRVHGTLDWQGRQIAVDLDSVGGLGEFIELEILTDETAALLAREAIRTLADHLNLSDAERRSYLELLLASESSGC